MFWISSGLIGAIFTGFILYRIAKKTSVGCAAVIVFIIPVFTMGGLFLARPSAGPGEKVFNIKARQFAYEPSIIKVNKGDDVILRIASKDVTHGFHLDGYGIDVEIKPHGHRGEEGHDEEGEEAHGHGKEMMGEHSDKGESKAHGHGKEAAEGHDDDEGDEPQGHEKEVAGHEEMEEMVTEIRFLAGRTGRFGFRCSRTCGSLHPFMVGTLIVEPNYLYPGSLGFALGLTLAGLLYIRKRKS